MTYQSRQLGSLSGSFFEAKASFMVGTSLVSPREPLASSLPPALTPLFYFNGKGGEKILCNPPQNLPKYSPDKPLRKKIRVLTYLLSEHNFLFLWPEAQQSYPIFGSNLNFLFNRDSPSFFPAPVSPLSDFQFPSICPAFCYSIGIKNLTRRVQNDGMGILPVEPDNLPVYGTGGGGDFSVYEANWGESKAVP
ncbi:hypothetical protein ES703_87455 [subsurface metagenome]